MSPPSFQVLDQPQAQHFLDKGYVVLKNCFSREAAQPWLDSAYSRAEADPQRPETWTPERLHLKGIDQLEIEPFAPKAWAGICDLLGGAERLADASRVWENWWIFNFPVRDHRPWEPPSPQVNGWHKDGSWFKHFLDSPEQGLLQIGVWSDIEPQGGGTFVACDSVKYVAEYMAERPQGCLPKEFKTLIDRCQDFVEITGQVGDVVLLHPYILHSASLNCSERVRLITNSTVFMQEPLNFNRENPQEFSLVERAVLNALGVDRLDFKPASARERIQS